MSKQILIAPRPKKDSKYLYYKFRHEKTWHTTYITNDGTKKSIQKAEDFALEILKEKNKKKNPKSFKEYSKDYFIFEKCDYIKRHIANEYSYKKDVAKHKRVYLEDYVWKQKTFSNMDITEHTALDCERLLADIKIKHNLASQTIRHIAYAVQIIFEDIRKDGYRTDNPMKDIKKPKLKKKKRGALNIEEVKSLFPHNKSQLLKIWEQIEYVVLGDLYFTSGCRRNELIIRQWKHLNWEFGYITVYTTLDSDGVITETKGKNQRAVKLPASTMKLLKAWYDITINKQPFDYIFPGRQKGSHIASNTVSKLFKRACTHAGIDVEGRNIVLHSTRHTYVTISTEEGIPQWFVQSQVDHKSDSVTNNYKHTEPSVLLEKRTKQHKEMMNDIDNIFDIDVPDLLND